MDNDPGNRFYPTEEQIILHYLEGKMQGRHFPNVIHEINICNFDPWDLPEQAAWRSNDPVWFFFSEPDYKYANSTRVNRKTKAGYWKPTGNERTIRDMHGREIGIKKNLVFYRASSSKKGTKTNWKPFVLFRLKRKSDDDGSDTCDEPTHQLPSQSQGNHEQPEQEPLPDVSEHPAAQGSSSSNGCNYQTNTGRSHMINSSYSTVQEDQEFVNSLWADREGEYSFEETVNTRLHEFNPPRSLRRDSSYTNAETIYSQLTRVVLTDLQWGNVLETPSFLSGNGSSKECRQIHMVQAPQSKKPRINCIRLVSEEFPVETRTTKAQHLLKSSPAKAYLPGKVSPKAVSRDEVRDDVKLAIDLPRKENPIVNYVKNQKIAQSSGKTSSKMRFHGWCNGSRKGYIIFLETPPLGHKPNQPSICIGNILLAALLFMFIIIREMESLH
ncbi:hypothetical protein EZV62_010130 [Acer yangbiense]|uniref:NAC domain-containing protein n=1 Tax=Acer yangbiense TaxID=1000413 RepID=A0A5C7I3G3_9ROSI|nr:hypothetical protein EZV62_010130 [Acer yangbiense]